ncbi:MAG: GNAT family N-acetyltransferase [Roseobacter sp.]
MNDMDKNTLIWRPMGQEDIPRIADWFWNASDASLFDRSLPVPVSTDALRAQWSHAFEETTPPSAFWYIAETENQTPLGIGGLEKINYIQGDAVLPFFVAEPFRKRGLARVMAISLTDMAFSQLRLHRLTTYYRSDNIGSKKILDRLGFTQEGRLREGWFTDGIRKDIVVAGILGSEWASQRDKVIADIEKNCSLTFSPNCWKAEIDRRY